MNLEQLKAKAIQIYNKKGFVDIFALATELGIEVAVVDDRDDRFNACIEYDKDQSKYRIIANLKHSMPRIRFSVAHEIAHYILHNKHIDKSGTLHRGEKTGLNYKTEKEADKVASEILMPTELVHKFLGNNNISKSNPVTEETINLVAEHFKVSSVAAAIKLKELGYFVSFIYVF